MTTTARPAVGTFRTPRAPALGEAELPGGLHAIGVRRPQVPIVQLRLGFPLGPAQLSHPAIPLVLSQSVLAGTRHHDRQSLAAAVERLGGRLAVAVVDDRLVLSASCLANRLRPLLAIVAEVLTGASYPAGEVEADRERTSDKVVRLLSRPEVLADEALGKRLFGSHPYGTPIPRPEALREVGAPAVRRLHRSIFRASSAHAVLVGDIQPRRALAALEDELAAWLEIPAAALRPLRRVAAVEPGALQLVDRQGSVQSNLRLGGLAPDRSEPDWPATLVANEILGGMFTSRIVENLREKHGYTYSPRSTVSHARAGSTFTVAAAVSTEVTAAALVETRYELGRIATTGVTVQEVEAARRYAIGSFLLRTATQSGLASMLVTLAVEGIGPGYLSGHPREVAAVERAQVDEAARRYFAPSALATVVVGDADVVAGPVARLEAVTIA